MTFDVHVGTGTFEGLGVLDVTVATADERESERLLAGVRDTLSDTLNRATLGSTWIELGVAPESLETGALVSGIDGRQWRATGSLQFGAELAPVIWDLVRAIAEEVAET